MLRQSAAHIARRSLSAPPRRCGRSGACKNKRIPCSVTTIPAFGPTLSPAAKIHNQLITTRRRAIVLPQVIDELKAIYKQKLLPVEQTFFFNRFYSPLMTDSEFEVTG